MVAVRRAHAGRHAESGHSWEHDGAVLDVEPGLASRLFDEPVVKMYTPVEPGETTEVDDDEDCDENLGARRPGHRSGPEVVRHPNDKDPTARHVERKGGGRGPDGL